MAYFDRLRIIRIITLKWHVCNQCKIAHVGGRIYIWMDERTLVTSEKLEINSVKKNQVWRVPIALNKRRQQKTNHDCSNFRECVAEVRWPWILAKSIWSPASKKVTQTRRRFDRFHQSTFRWRPGFGSVDDKTRSWKLILPKFQSLLCVQLTCMLYPSLRWSRLAAALRCVQSTWTSIHCSVPQRRSLDCRSYLYIHLSREPRRCWSKASSWWILRNHFVKFINIK